MGDICGDILDIFGIIREEDALFAVISGVETRDAAENPTMHRTSPQQQRMIWPQISTV